MAINDKQKEFILQYCTNGHNASQAYKKAYPNTKGGWNKLSARLMAKEGIKQAISKYMAKVEHRADVTVDSLTAKFEETYDFAKKCNQPSAMSGCVTGMARLRGLDKDASDDSQERELTEAEQVEANRYAMWKLSQGKREVG